MAKAQDNKHTKVGTKLSPFLNSLSWTKTDITQQTFLGHGDIMQNSHRAQKRVKNDARNRIVVSRCC